MLFAIIIICSSVYNISLFRKRKMQKTVQLTLQTIFLIFSLIAVKSHSTVNKLRGVYSWKALEFAFPNSQAREDAILLGDFIPGNPVPIDVDVDYRGENLIFFIIIYFYNFIYCLNFFILIQTFFNLILCFVF